MKCVGIDIGSFSIKVAEIDASSSNSISLARFDEYPFSPDPQKDRQLQTIEILRSIAQNFDDGARFVIAVPQHLTAGRLRRFPFRERSKILKSLPFELEDDMPLDPDDTIFDAKIVEFAGSGAFAWCVAAPQDAVRETMQGALEGGIDPEILSVEGLALANLCERWAQPPPEAPQSRVAAADPAMPPPESAARAIVSIGHARTLVLVYRDGALVSARSLLWGGQDVANALMSAFSVPYFEALKILQEKSFILMNANGATRDQMALSQAVSESVERLARPLKLALLETKSELALSYSEIELSGGASQIQNLGPFLTQLLEVPCNVGRPLANVRSYLDDSPQIQAAAPVAVGLAIEGAKRGRNPAINMRRGTFARQNLTAKRLWEKWGYATKVAGAALMVFVVYAIARDEFASSLADKAEEAAMTVAKNVGIAKPSDAAVQKHIARQKKLIKANETLSSLEGFTSALDVLAKISASVPAQSGGRKVEMNIGRVDVDNDDVFIQGTIDQAHQKDVQGWLQKVARANSVKAATPQGPPPKGATGAAFAFSMKASRLP